MIFNLRKYSCAHWNKEATLNAAANGHLDSARWPAAARHAAPPFGPVGRRLAAAPVGHADPGAIAAQRRSRGAHR